jgi:hypothetical protein
MSQFYYVDLEGNRQGPLEQAAAVELMRSGQIRASTLVWAAGMEQWAPADQSPMLRDQFTRILPPGSMPPPPPAAPPPPVRPPSQPVQWGAASEPVRWAGSSGPLNSAVGVWDLFWRAVVMTFGDILVVPAPWTHVMFWRYVAQTTRLPDGFAFEFEGRPGDIWWVFVAQALSLWIAQIQYGGIFELVVAFIAPYLTLRWFCKSLRTRTGESLAFNGGFWANTGYALLLGISVVTIVGWAWVARAWMQWLCRNVSGPTKFEFVGTGVEILWRTVVFSFGACFLIPIPWLAAWWMRWLVSQIRAA